MSTLTQMWETRPPRIPGEQGGHGHVAGVCEGIAVRYQIDPLILRIGFVVLALSGGGIAAYLAAWLIMPRYSVPVAPIQALFKPEYPRERTQGWWLLFFFIIFSGVLGAGVSEFFGSTTLIALGAAALAWWALHKKEPHPPAGLLTTDIPQEPSMTQQPQPDLSGITPAEGYPYPPGRTTPPAWDPLGTAPFAWDLPDPTAPAPAKRQGRVWPWVVLGIGSLSALTLLGGGLIFGLTHTDGYNGGEIGDTHHAPSSVGELLHTYRGGVGESTVDLRNLGELPEGQQINIEGGIGQLDVFLPDDIPIELTCAEGLGDSGCVAGSYNEDAEGEILNIHIESGIGETTLNWG
ncbi:PspC domain-containing protein [Corynebacterium sp. A21]|uniref:PspC domain-containing protein n=1 Tax=Corynebacterium sp. A21 TaxID=3457318 RepID=UPI003FD3AE39